MKKQFTSSRGREGGISHNVILIQDNVAGVPPVTFYGDSGEIYRVLS
ncbi:hypothetical protein [Sulfuracidifex tepidarius]|uniref:Uncharacterized protein n=1 Tax=Sulfuracidifex tepidarius TaxID=1294262 RepID=A0A510E0L3_9CREN|nr:hypothetical protein [Sulfuracidifex tepidarius]BBG23283.1 hypothetical protein IC006_0567 [Sulfuracidifex tepidarius]BBG26035.1 hypothetical protein IC007_0540 [Sulfuracidifex tepidarius]